MFVPPLGPVVPARGNAVSRAIGRTYMSLGGWKFEGAMPNEPKFVVIVVPHTSNWDFTLGTAALFALGFRVSFLGKHTLFKWPLGVFMRWLGGIPVERSVSRDRVTETVGAFKASDQLILAVAPEGTRKLVTQWKTGFYHVALGANVPIVPVAFDYGRKTVRIGPAFRPTGDMEADFAELKSFYRDVVARRPENFQL
jgi:1-acyl-sn-glycerol-3-phosphate acyltransferase